LREGVPGAHLVSALLRRPHSLLSAILLGNNLVNTGAAAVGTVIAGELIAGGSGVLAATVIITILLVLFGEVTPKTMALSHAFTCARLYAVPLRLWANLNRPIVAMLDTLTRLLIRVFGGEQLTGAPAMSAAELRTAIRVGAEAGALETDASELLLGALTLQQRQVQEIMVSRMDMVAVAQDQPLIEVASQLSEVGFQRLPVYAASPEEVTGYVHVSDLNAAHLEGLGDRIARDIMRPAIFQSEHAPIANVLDLMRNRGAYLVMLVDEFGVTSGLVTLEDIMEEVVGRIRSESGEEPSGLEEGRRTGRLILDGSTLLVDLSNELDVDLTDVDANTVAGLILHHMRRFPDRGEYIDLYGFRFTVLAMDQRRIARVAVEPLEATVPPPVSAE
jgi:putative hemolysin